MQQRESVGGSTYATDAVTHPSFQVTGGGEAGNHGGAGGGNGGVLVSTPGPKVHAGTAVGGDSHT